MATRLCRRLFTSFPQFGAVFDCCHRRNGFLIRTISCNLNSQRKNEHRMANSSFVKFQRQCFSAPPVTPLVQHTRVSRRFLVTSQRPTLEHSALTGRRPLATSQRSLETTSDQSEREPQPASHSPYRLVQQELSTLSQDIKLLLQTSRRELRELAEYYFDGQGKAFRPMLVLLLSKALNFHQDASNRILKSQRQVALITEMIHTASLVHDDVIDAADMRRNKPSVNRLWGQRRAILAGDFILSVAAMTLAQIRNEEVVVILSEVIEDLVRGEFMQLGSKEDENERFSHYLKKTFKKTASLLANSCKAVAVLGHCSEELVDLAFQYGRHIGIAFQLIDDLLDYVSSEAVLGKPTSADLKLGLATAPVLFAAQEYPELHPLIMRRFSGDGDVERAVHLVKRSDGVRQTRLLAEKHAEAAVTLLQPLTASHARSALIEVAGLVLRRQK